MFLDHIDPLLCTEIQNGTAINQPQENNVFFQNSVGVYITLHKNYVRCTTAQRLNAECPCSGEEIKSRYTLPREGKDIK